MNEYSKVTLVIQASQHLLPVLELLMESQGQAYRPQLTSPLETPKASSWGSLSRPEADPGPAQCAPLGDAAYITDHVKSAPGAVHGTACVPYRPQLHCGQAGQTDTPIQFTVTQRSRNLCSALSSNKILRENQTIKVALRQMK